MGYVELHAHSAYSFLDGASHPEELALRAAELGYEALALTDHDGVFGSLELAHAAKLAGVRAITGTEVTLVGGAHMNAARPVVAGLRESLPPAHRGARAQALRKVSLLPALDRALLAELNDGLVCLSGCARDGLGVRDPNAAVELARVSGRSASTSSCSGRSSAATLAGTRSCATSQRTRASRPSLQATSTHTTRAAPRSRTSSSRSATTPRSRRASERRGNRESILRPPADLLELFPDDRDAVLRTAEIAERLEFDLTEELGYRYPDFSDGDVPAIERLAEVCNDAFASRYPPSNRLLLGQARARLESELKLIDELGLAGFFLLHWEVLELARELADGIRGPGSPRRFLPPGRGRGSSVGSIVCYLTGLSHVDPVAQNLSLGRFLNRELMSAPDIDLDFPRDIREQLIVGVTERYGREHASLVASFSTYRARRDPRRRQALGLPFAELERLARVSDGWNATKVADELALLPEAERRLLSPRWRAFAELTREIAGLPRHISQHPGGMVISSRPLIELVPVQPAAMTGRQICQWDKDSCSDAGFLKIDLLGLGMLSAVEDCVEQIAEVYGEPIDLSRIPLDDAAVFAEIQKADTIGDFQIESRAQMQSLLRTKPENLDDLTVQVALVRPGPIQGRRCIRTSTRANGCGSIRRTCRRSTTSCCASRSRHARRRRLPGSGARGGDGARRLHDRRGRGPAARDEPEAERGGDRGVPGAVRRGRGAERGGRGDGRQGLRQARGLLRLRLPEVARGRVRAPGLPVGVAAALPGRVPLRAPERAADGLLSALVARARRRSGAASRCGRRT